MTEPDEPTEYRALYSPLDRPTRRIWALFDSTPGIPEPANILMSPSSPFFIVHAASPRSEYHGWHKKRNPRNFYMKPWSLSELIQAYVDTASGGFMMLTFPTVVNSSPTTPQNASCGNLMINLVQVLGICLNISRSQTTSHLVSNAKLMR